MSDLVKTFTVQKDQELTVELSQSGSYLVELLGEGASVFVKGTFLVQDSDKVDINLIVHHKAKNTRAETLLKGVARDSASVRFFGRIKIDEGCGASNSFLTERILLLSDTAKAEAVPELEILTDDVKCSHAASVSKIPDEQIFYLQSRGIDKKNAEDLIVEGFLN